MKNSNWLCLAWMVFAVSSTACELDDVSMESKTDEDAGIVEDVAIDNEGETGAEEEENLVPLILSELEGNWTVSVGGLAGISAVTDHISIDASGNVTQSSKSYGQGIIEDGYHFEIMLDYSGGYKNSIDVDMACVLTANEDKSVLSGPGVASTHNQYYSNTEVTQVTWTRQAGAAPTQTPDVDGGVADGGW